MSWNHKLYPKNWKELALACKIKAGFRCEMCGIAHGLWRVGTKYGREYQVRITAAHLDHDPENPNPRLMAMCERCHNKYDMPVRAIHMHLTKQRERFETQVKAGQLFWFPSEVKT